jgi:hypothetical protein
MLLLHCSYGKVRAIQTKWDGKSIAIFSEIFKEDQNLWVFINFEITRQVLCDMVVKVVMLILCCIASVPHPDTSRNYVLKSLACNSK